MFVLVSSAHMWESKPYLTPAPLITLIGTGDCIALVQSTRIDIEGKYT